MNARRSTAPPAPQKVATPLHRTLTHRLHTLHKLSDRISQTAYQDAVGMSMSEGRCLAAVGAFEPLSVKELAVRANLDKGQASRAAQTLVEQDMVHKGNNTSDARGVVLTLTPPGRARWRSVMQLIERRNNEIFGELSDEEREVLGHILDRLIDKARTDLDSVPIPDFSNAGGSAPA